MRRAQNRKMFTIVQTILLLVSIQICSAEIASILKDAANNEGRRLTNKNKVMTYDQCKKYLCKYGYLTCNCAAGLTRKKRQVLANGLFPSEFRGDNSDSSESNSQPTYPLPRVITSKIPCTRTDYSNAIKTFQKNYRLSVTGNCDAATMNSMSQRRCGQPDIMDKLSDESQPTNTRTKRSLSDIFTKSTQLDKSIERRKQMFEEYKRSVQGEVINNGGSTRERRSIFNVTINDDYGGLWTKMKITWRLMSDHYNPAIPPASQRAILKQAFRYWSEISPMCFVEDNRSTHVDIEIGFLEGVHLSCYRQFDGFGGEIAHKFYSDVHFDNSEPYTIEPSSDGSSDSAISLLLVAVHEVGHVIGLNHSDISNSVMNAIYHRSIKGEFELSAHDRLEVTRAYGPCKGRLDTAFDFVRWQVNLQGEEQRVFNTYFFRDSQYWMYENSNNHPRYGDPLKITPTGQNVTPLWKDVPNFVDAFMHYFEVKIGNQIIDEHFFFKADRYYYYDSKLKRVDDMGYIRDKFPAGSMNESVPSNLDSVFFDMRNKLTYFFKGEYVYTYEYKSDVRHSCCVEKQKIIDLFPPASSNDLRSPEGNTYTRDIDCVYFSYSTTSAYIIKGEDVWQNVAYRLSPEPSSENRMVYRGKWYTLWQYLCDAECS